MRERENDKHAFDRVPHLLIILAKSDAVACSLFAPEFWRFESAMKVTLVAGASL